jgi:hypothetical protein
MQVIKDGRESAKKLEFKNREVVRRRPCFLEILLEASIF